MRPRTHYNPGMSESDRSDAITTACDDLQAQIEAGDRSMRHIDHEVELLNEAISLGLVHADRLGNLQRRMNEMRTHMLEQRTALREVRKAARTLCASVARARERTATLANEQAVLERDHPTVRAEFKEHPVASDATKPDPEI